ncbi:MAG: tetratricopeptide repeat protein [Xanthomonadales bacterium]|nr:tetratricopeptide repeat protein [Gammaproteobacteria bacterium]NNL05063.1 tetratricopeptide repeat protein [Xanthomonadales bacterium]
MSATHQNTGRWEWLALAAAAFVVIALPAYWLIDRHEAEPDSNANAPQFVGSVECKDCHLPEWDNWEGSHHDLAMDVANETTVRGDFDNSEFSHRGITSRFFRRDGGFFVYTNGPGGEMGEFEITHTFGWTPLQQYLVPFPGGRLQTLPIAWDTEEEKWFRVPPDEDIAPDDWLYWTNAAQNWNGMCAQCHSTNLEKNYDPETDSYDTTWSDIDVGCEACHGPGSDHVTWAQMPDMARPAKENYELVLKTSDIESVELVELCAPCHSRRASLDDLNHTETELMHSFLPALLDEGLYYADGQILDEVYVYGSFIQSKMYDRGVMCSDCHDPHSVERVLEGNLLCTQCHREAQYDTYEHHFHKQEGEEGEPIRSANGDVLWAVGTGAQCETCHMPGRYYMGNDYRPDHSFRVPNPRLAAETGSPDACLRCHVDEDAEWSQAKAIEWYGPGDTSHYGDVLFRGRRSEPGAAADLANMAFDDLYPVNVRATAVVLLGRNYSHDVSRPALDLARVDEEPLIRHAALQVLNDPDSRSLARKLARALEDPVRGVRIEAASRLAGALSEQLDIPQKERLSIVLAEYEDAMRYSADFPFGRYNLGNLYSNLGQPERAIDAYENAIRIDNQFYPAKANLALLYNQRGENDRAEALLREVVESQPEMYDLAYSLGLLLVEMQRAGEALPFLAQASEGLPGSSRIHYNLGLLYQQQGDIGRAEQKLIQALSLEPANLDYQYGLADHYIKRGLFERAVPLVEAMVTSHPENPIGMQMMQFLQRAMSAPTDR